MCDKDVARNADGYAASPEREYTEKAYVERTNRNPPPGVTTGGGSFGNAATQQANNKSRQLIWKYISEHEQQVRAFHVLLGMLPTDMTYDQDYNLQVLLQRK